ncbi:MAG TPA: hypothetical protein ENK57_11035 [Polyangiaceae bacterium]|nr:hypothetical protein [Polyangiaceae bacterium]
MTDYKLKGLHGRQRRRFLKWMTATGAAVGMTGSHLLNFLADEGGHGLAEAATNSGHRALGVTCGNGVYAWFQQLWPSPDVALTAQTNNGFAGSSSWLFTPQHGYQDGYVGTLVQNAGGKPMYYGPDAPWFDHGAGTPIRPVTAMIAGNDETHTEFPESAAIVSGNASLPATVGAIQSAKSSAVVPVLGIDPLKYGRAQGAPDVVTAPTPEGIVDLFNSAASQFTLATPEDQELFESYYKAFLKLRRASGRSSWAPQLEITKNAARLIGLNFEAALTPTAQDLVDYGLAAMLSENMTAMQMNGLDVFGRTLITVARAFKLGLTNSAIVALSPGPTSEQTFTDPHTTGDSANSKVQGRNVTKYLGRILDGFYNDLGTAEDPEDPGKNLDETTVFFAWGDTPHTPLQLNNWPDATPQDSNWIYCMGQGQLNPGWYGQVHANGDVSGWDPTTGEDVMGQPASQTANAAGAAISYAVARGDMNTVSQYYVGPPIDGVVTG